MSDTTDLKMNDPPVNASVTTTANREPKEHDRPHSAAERERKAAEAIQRRWRKTKEKGKGKRKISEANGETPTLNTDLRWKDAAVHAQLKMDRIGADKGKNAPVDRWKRGAFFAQRLQAGNEPLRDSGVSMEETGADVKKLETQHWLELIDGKHRYGSNLKWYHRRWQAEDTTDNFFRWLDHGEGKGLTLDECPREQLEKERIQYLSAEQRLNYLVAIDSEGKLRWAKDNELVDTTANHWKDSGDGKGIVRDDNPEPSGGPQRRDSFTASISSDSSAESQLATHYAGGETKGNAITRTFRKYFTVRGTADRLLRKTIRRNTWIYITDKQFNIFIGIKETGSFQHSTFLSGGLVTSAGLISVKDGVIYTLSPLSGHYRTTVDHFHQFVKVMTDRGVDMHKAKVSKAEAALWGIEHIGKFKKSKDDTVGKMKHGVKVAAAKATPGEPNWKMEILTGRKKGQEEDRAEKPKSDERKAEPRISDAPEVYPAVQQDDKATDGPVGDDPKSANDSGVDLGKENAVKDASTAGVEGTDTGSALPPREGKPVVKEGGSDVEPKPLEQEKAGEDSKTIPSAERAQETEI